MKGTELGYCDVKDTELIETFRRNRCLKLQPLLQKRKISWRKPVTLHNSVKLHLKQVFQSVYRHELETKLSQKPCKQELVKIPDWPKRKAIAEFRSCVECDCLGTHLHRTPIRPEPYCMLYSLHELTDRNHLGQCRALCNWTECERHWEAGTKMVENWLGSFSIINFVTAAYCWDFCIGFGSCLCFSLCNAQFIVSI